MSYCFTYPDVDPDATNGELALWPAVRHDISSADPSRDGAWGIAKAAVEVEDRRSNSRTSPSSDDVNNPLPDP